ncbi:MAG: hypothetical protein JG781_788 [Peptococcaceae bacterium]|nr:hypothetical protein [Peptococcaceae bacterium]
MRKKFNLLIGIVLITALLFTLTGCASKDSKAVYPSKPVNMIIAFTAGGSSDVQARVVEKFWKKEFNNQPLVFDYKVGAGGQVGFTEITKANPDGYTIGGINVPHIVFQALSSQATFKTEDFAYIAQVVKDPLLLAVKKDSPINNLNDFIAEAKKKDGKMNVGIVGPFTAHHVGIFQLADELKIKVNPVIFKGAADQNVALLGGHVDAMLGNLNDVMRDLNNFKILALADDQRHPWIKDVPTFKEQNVNFKADIRRGFAAPKNIKPEVLQKLREGFKKICNDPEYLKEMEKIGQPAAYLSGEEFEKYVQEYTVNAKSVIEKYGLK